MEVHKQRVADVAAKVRRYHELNQPFRISHGATNSTRPTASRTATISTAHLCNILDMDGRESVLVEPNVPMDALIAYTVKRGAVPKVAMEFPGITVGGGYSGTSGESSSFKHGFFNETLNWVELVLGNGEVVRASPTERADLFYGAAGTCGTLGIITLAEIQLEPASKYVEAAYQPVTSLSEAVNTIKRKTKDPEIQYLDGIMFSPGEGVIITGRPTDSATSRSNDAPIVSFTKASDPWFYTHVQSLFNHTITNNELHPATSSTTKKATPTPPQPITDLIPTPSYLFRYDRGGFWVGRSTFSYFFDLIPFTPLTRWLLDDFMRTRMLYKALHASGYSNRYMVQDCAVPYERAVNFMEWSGRETGIWPLWLCPLRAPRTEGGDGGGRGRGGGSGGTFHPSSRDEDGRWRDMLNIGLWGKPAKSALGSTDAWISLNKRLEAELMRLEGRKWLYAHCYYTREEWDGMYGREWYGKLREKYHAQSLPRLYDKVSRSEGTERRRDGEWGAWVLSVWPLAAFYGLVAAMWSGEFRKARGSWWFRGEEE